MAKESLNIKVVVANKLYPLEVNTVEEEEAIRNSAEIINDLMLRFQEENGVDEKDALVMSFLAFVKQYVLENDRNTSDLRNLQERVVQMQDRIQKYI